MSRRRAASRNLHLLPALVLAALLAGCEALPPAPGAGMTVGTIEGTARTGQNKTVNCAATGRWADGRTGEPLTHAAVMARAADAPFVLLGEEHDRIAHQVWELSVVAGMLGRAQPLVVGLEMLPRSAAPALARWTTGASDEAAFLAESRWEEVWGDATPYLPLLRFVRLYGLDAVPLNVSRQLIRRVAQNGWNAVPDGEREGVDTPAPAPAAYRQRLAEVFSRHGGERGGEQDGAHGGVEPAAANDRLTRFVAAQLVWDRAMAEALVDAARRFDAPVLGIVGAEHARLAQGIPHQLAALGAPPALVLLAWPSDAPCPTDSEGRPAADAVFGIAPREAKGSAVR